MSVRAGPSQHKQKSFKKATKSLKHKKSVNVKRTVEKQKINDLERAAAEYAPSEGLKAFDDLPISDFTKRGLKKAFFVNMTDIQAKSIPFALKGNDILGAARTGSGKTLAFLIPVLEILYRRKWGHQDGLGALIISPTRELAVQIFEVLRSIGGFHTFSAGLVIGGKNLKEERDRLLRMNILVSTPGRLLQHMDQTVWFQSNNVQMLVLDEADRILDMGFSRTLTAILSHLPKSRQTLLFSATQTQSVDDLARLSLKSPEYISAGSTTTPTSLEQHYVVCPLDKKLDILWSFIKSHLQSKVLVFMSSCKQVRFVFETFCKMHPGIPLLHLHGKQKQMTRLAVYDKFTKSSHAVLFATDIAARGLDFPSVDWVLQVDAPEDVETYIHRVGRTARYEKAGKGLLFLMPSEEEGMKAAFTKKDLQVEAIKIKGSKTMGIENQLQNLAFKEPEIKYLGQRAFVSYLRSVYLQKDKSIFKLEELPIERFAESLGLPGAPKIKFLSREIAKKKNASWSVAAAEAPVERRKSATDESEDEEGSSGENGNGESTSGDEETNPTSPNTETRLAKTSVRTKYDRMFQRKNQDVLSKSYRQLIHRSDEDEDEEFITLKRADHDLPLDPNHQERDANLSKRKQKLGKSKLAISKYGDLGKKLVFDDEGKPHELYEMADAEDLFKGGVDAVNEAGKMFAEKERGKMKVADMEDKREAKEKKRERKRKRKEREKDAESVPPAGAALLSDDHGYESPVFDMPASRYDDASGPPSKRSKTLQNSGKVQTIDDEEELASRLLRTTRR